MALVRVAQPSVSAGVRWRRRGLSGLAKRQRSVLSGNALRELRGTYQAPTRWDGIMKRYLNDPTPDPESSGMPTDMRDCRSIWQRVVGMFQGYKPLPWYW